MQGASSSSSLIIIMDLIGFFQGSGQTSNSGTPPSYMFLGFTIDMLRVPYSFGTAVGPHTVRIAAAQVQSVTFSLDIERYSFISQAQAVNSYSIEESRWTAGLDDYRLSDAVSLSYGAPDPASGDVDVLLGPSTSGAVPPPNLTSLVGQTIILRHQVYSINAFTFSDVNLQISGVDLYAIGGMGVVCTRCFDLSFESFRISRPRNATAADRPVSITADGIHVCNQQGGHLFSLTNSHISSQGDDCLNINAPMARIQNISVDRSTIVATGYGNSAPPVSNGDTINVVDRSTLEFSYQVASDFVVVGDSVSLSTPGATWPEGKVRVGDLIYAANAMTTNAVIQGTYFGQNRARGMLIRGEHFVVSGNVFDRNSGPSVLVVIDGCTFFEGPLLYDFEFSDNTVINPNLGPASSSGAILSLGQTPTFTPAGIPVPNTCTTSSAIAFINFTIANNAFVFNLTDPLLSSPTSSVYTEIVAGLMVANNMVHRNGAVLPPTCEFNAVQCSGQQAANNVCHSSSSTGRDGAADDTGSGCALCGF